MIETKDKKIDSVAKRGVFTENAFARKDYRGKLNLVYSESSPNAGKPFGQIIANIISVSATIGNALKALYVEKGDYLELPNPITFKTSNSHLNRTKKMPKFSGILSNTTGTDAWGNSTGGISTISLQDVAIITDLQIRVYLLEQMVIGNFNALQHKDINSV